MNDPKVRLTVRSPGRPRLDDQPLERVSTRVPLDTYDRLTEIAEHRNVSVSMLVRQLLVLRLKP